MSLLAPWLRNAMRRYNRAITYCVVGSAIALIQIGLTAVIAKGGVADPAVASVVASMITIPISFWAHKRTTYADVTRQRFQATRFALTACSGIIIAAGTIKIVTMNGGPFWFALFLGSALVPIGNYIVNAIWVFRTNRFFSIDGRP